jgi:hypothetical protein
MDEEKCEEWKIEPSGIVYDALNHWFNNWYALASGEVWIAGRPFLKDVPDIPTIGHEPAWPEKADIPGVYYD